ncbi:MAG: 1-phosphofructokinase family hexose kinase [Blastocatellia bacterium]
MILCVSANPAIDRRLRMERLTVGAVNRAYSAEAAPGGKAAHVAMAARALGEESLWIGFLGGATGEECERGLTALGIQVNAVRISAATRVNLEIIDDAGVVTEALEPGGAVTAEEVSRMFRVCRELFARHREKAVAVMSGSLAPGAPDDFYATLIRAARASGCRTLLDASGKPLLAALEAAPDLVKPNREEATWATKLAVTGGASAVEAARRMIERGARSAAISLGADGLVWLREKDAAPLFAPPLKVDARSAVGSGDATIAGFAVAAMRGLDAEDTLRLATACGAANCMAPLPGRIQASEVDRLALMAPINNEDTS